MGAPAMASSYRSAFRVLSSRCHSASVFVSANAPTDASDTATAKSALPTDRHALDMHTLCVGWFRGVGATGHLTILARTPARSTTDEALPPKIQNGASAHGYTPSLRAS